MIRVEHLSKSFESPHERVHTLKESVLHPRRNRAVDRLEALRDVSFEVAPGEFYGIVGRNGSGKSTLLRCLAGIYRPDGGRILCAGRVASFIELGVGFNPDLAARDNVVVNGTMLGLTRSEARRRYDDVMEFAGLRDVGELKVKNYSSGMLVRLAFAVMIQVDADILLIDEVLAVGDAEFQQKCHDEFARLRRSGTTVLLVTHDMGYVEQFCDRALVLERGIVAEDGAPRAIAEHYLRLNFSEADRDAVTPPAEDAVAEAPQERDPLAPDRWGDGAAHITDGWFEDSEGRRAGVLLTGQRCTYAARVRFEREVVDPLFGVNVHNVDGDRMLTANNLLEPPSGRFGPGDEVEFRIAFENVWAAGRYLASPAVAHSGAGSKWIDRCVNLHDVTVIATSPTDALIAPPYDVTISRVGATSRRTG
jgi:ABC-2 type transport system ATP-binding protein